MSSRTWVKINCDRWFEGSIRKESPVTRSLWTDLIALAGRTGQDGVIRLPGTNIGYTDEQLASIFNVELPDWIKAKQLFSNHPQGNGENRIVVNPNNTIEIIKWSTYQSEYARQKPHREPDFKKSRNLIKERDEYTCQECNKHRDELKVPLCVHHIDNDPSNNDQSNLITLCISCHSKLLKASVHPHLDRSHQEERFRKIVQEKGSIEGFSGDKNRLDGEKIDFELEEGKENTKRSRKVVFVPPSIEEVREYCAARRNKIDPEAFHAWYATRGWKLNTGIPMVNWKAAIVTWEKRG